MTIDLDALEKLADEATPGPWIVQDGCSWRRIGTRHGDGDVLCPTNHHRDNHPDLTAGRGHDTYANLNFIAAANPATIKALIAELKDARSVIKPLADCEIIEPDQPLADDITARYLFSMGEIRAARAFLARNAKGEG